MLREQFTHVVIHYDEIGLKSGNRKSFDARLKQNALAKLGPEVGNWKREMGQFTLTLSPDADRATVLDTLTRIPGIAYISPALRCNVDMEAMKTAAVALLREVKFQTFAIRARRHDKQLPYTSVDVNRVLGAAVLQSQPDKRVRIKDPDVCLKVELTPKHAYLSFEMIPGVGGLPTNPRQKVVALLSGGLDSPVAAYLMMKRGCEVTLAHFQNQNQMTHCVQDKIIKLAEQLSRYQVKTRLYVIPFETLQREIIKTVHSKMRMLVYRRVMLRLAGAVAAKHRARFLVVGDSFSQVASQTYDNLSATYADSALPILTPLIGLDKKEITAISREIGTFDISALPYGDCCTFFLPKHPELRGRVDDLREHESRFDLESLGREAVEQSRLIEW